MHASVLFTSVGSPSSLPRDLCGTDRLVMLRQTASHSVMHHILIGCGVFPSLLSHFTFPLTAASRGFYLPIKC